MMTTPFEKTQNIGAKIVASLRLSALLEEIDAMTPEERETPENKALIELVNVLILSLPIGDKAEG